mmetsp:Transcript_13755/g.44198  ORF Transcript_13755/g.44198 Transcript_13755/m.44198 type:complete len:240 (-) Transcript_13755:2374-3093(-)
MLQVQRQRGRHPLRLAQHPLPRRLWRPVRHRLLRHEARAHRVHQVGGGLHRPQRRARLQVAEALGVAHRVEDGALLPRLPAAGAEPAGARQPARPGHPRAQPLALHPRLPLPAPLLGPARLHRQGERRGQDRRPVEGGYPVHTQQGGQRALRLALPAKLLRPEPARAAAAPRLHRGALPKLLPLPAADGRRPVPDRADGEAKGVPRTDPLRGGVLSLLGGRVGQDQGDPAAALPGLPLQ